MPERTVEEAIPSEHLIGRARELAEEANQTCKRVCTVVEVLVGSSPSQPEREKESSEGLIGEVVDLMRGITSDLNQIVNGVNMI